jgi:hypothetical protein
VIGLRHPHYSNAAARRLPGDLDVEHDVSGHRISNIRLIALHISLVDQELDESVANLVQIGLGQNPIIIDRDDCIRLQLPGRDRTIGSACTSGAKDGSCEREEDAGEEARSFHDDLIMVFEHVVR